MSAKRDFYVYVHRDKDGGIFYVGQGAGRRAWSKDRHAVWQKYVTERLAGIYSVEIIRDRLTEDESLDLERELISKYGAKLVNWINDRRQFDYSALAEYHRKRDTNRAFVA